MEAVPVEGRLPGGLFPMRTCTECGWKLHTAEALRDHRFTVHGFRSKHHGARREAPVHVPTGVEDHGVSRSLQRVGAVLHAKLAVA